jgi:hypothetical protein
MDDFKAFDPDSEVIGQQMLAFVQCVNNAQIMPYLEKHGLATIIPDKWYPLQSWLDVLHDLTSDRGGNAMFDLVGIGMKMVDTSVAPPGPEQLPFDEALEMVNAVNRLNHRNGDIGEYIIERVADRHVKVIARVPYPDDFLYGMFYGGTRRFLPPGTRFTVSYDDSAPRRGQDGETTIIHIKWE